MIKCRGCGIVLQNTNPQALGYTISLDKDYCERCFKIKYYGEYKIVDKDYHDYVEILKQIGKQKDLIVFLIDIININNSVLDTLKLLNNNVLLVVTKRDVLPLSLTDEKIYKYIDYLNLKLKDKLIISSKKDYNLDVFYAMLKKYQTSPKVYIVGNTNTGKSTLINKMLYNYATYDKEIVTSFIPSTTLDTLDIILNDDLTLVDTPGLIETGNITNYLGIASLKKANINKLIKPITYQISRHQNIIIEDFLRIEIKQGNITLYMSNNLKIERFYKPINKLNHLKKQELKVENSDVLILGLGFIRVKGIVEFNLFTIDGVEVLIRPSII